MKESLLAVVGPTAVGKTKISVELAKALNGEIINADAMQVYRGMDIGTAKPSLHEMAGIPHHLFDIKAPYEPYSAAEFQSRARPLVTAINQRGRLPIVVGGTGLYMKALTHGYQFHDLKEDPEYRRDMEVYAEEHGPAVLYDKLRRIDPESAAKIHPNNVRRVVRTLEIVHMTGESAERQKRQHDLSPYQLATIGLTMDRTLLYERINHRVDDMIASGLIEEACALYDQGAHRCQAGQAIGYKEVFSYFRGKQNEQEMVQQLKKNSRRFAKRQYTWFNRQMEVSWFDLTHDAIDKKIAEILRFVGGKL